MIRWVSCVLAVVGASALAGGVAAPAARASVPYFKALPASGNTELQTPRWRASGVSLPNGGALIAGGVTPTAFIDSAELFNPSTDTFLQLPDSGSTRMTTARGDEITAPLPNGKILIAGGYLPGGHWLQSAEIFDPSNNTFTALPASGSTELQTPRAGAIAAPLPSGRVLIAGGINNNVVLQTAEIFDPSNDTFTALPASGHFELQTPRYGAVAVALPGGNILIAGGDNGSGAVRTAEIFNEPYGTFDQLAASGNTELQTPRKLAVAAVLPSGKVLIAGGQDANGITLQSAEVFDPSFETFSALPASDGTELQVPRQGAVAIPVSGGVLIAGGDNASGAVVQSAELVSEVSPPTCSNTSASTASGSSQATVLLHCVNSGSAPLSYSITSGPRHGTLGMVDQTGGSVVYTPAPGFSGQDTFTYTATNVAGQANTATATVTVPSNSPPPYAKVTASTSGPVASLRFYCQDGLGHVCAGAFTVTVREHKCGRSVTAVSARKHRTKCKPRTVQLSLGGTSYNLVNGATQTTLFTLNRTGKNLLARLYSLRATFSFRASSGPTISSQVVRFSYQRIKASLNVYFTNPAVGYTTVDTLTLGHLAKRASVELRCRGEGCPFGRRQITPHTQTLALAHLFAGRHLRSGATLQIAVTAPNVVGSVWIFTMKPPHTPALTNRCLPPGYRRPAVCA